MKALREILNGSLINWNGILSKIHLQIYMMRFSTDVGGALRVLGIGCVMEMVMDLW